MNPPNPESKVTIHMVASLDGFIARNNDDPSWMHSHDRYESGEELTEEKINAFLNSIDCYVMGSKTFDHAEQLGWPYGATPVFVFTSRKTKSIRKNVTFLTGNASESISDIKGKFRNIWLVGGALMTRTFLKKNLADEIVLTIMPIILGEGVPFFDNVKKESLLHLKDSVAYNDGMVELTYDIIKTR